MGFILSKFRRSKPPTKDLLEQIDKELRSIQRFQVDTELQQKKIIGRLIIFSAVGYVLSAVVFYFLTPRGLHWKDQLVNVAPFVAFPLLMLGVKRFVTWYYQQKIVRKKDRYAELKKEKQRILEDVMDNETFKVGKEILEKYAPSQLLPKHLSDQLQLQQTMSPAPLQPTPGVGQRLAAFGATPTQAGFNEGLRRRQQQGGRPSMGGPSSTAVMSTPVRSTQQQQRQPQLQLQQFSHQQQQQQQQRAGYGYTNRQDLYQGRFGPSQQYLRQSTNSINRPVLALTSSPTPYSPQSIRFRSGVAPVPNPSYMLPLPPSNPVVHNRSLGWMDKLVEYVIGDGPSSRFALICRYCATHNGLATAEEFPYLGYRCAFCKQFNPPKQVRPAAPKLPTNTVLIEELESTVKTGETTTMDSEAEKNSTKEQLQMKNNTESEGQSVVQDQERDEDNSKAQVELAQSTDDEDQRRDSITSNSKPSTEEQDQDIDDNRPASGSGSGSDPEVIEFIDHQHENQTDSLDVTKNQNNGSLEPVLMDLDVEIDNANVTTADSDSGFTMVNRESDTGKATIENPADVQDLEIEKLRLSDLPVMNLQE